MIFILYSTFLFFVLNYILKFYFDDFNRRYYILHALLNSYIVFSTYSNFLESFDLDNFVKVNNILNTVPIQCTIGLHIFHTFNDYKKLSITDWVHHILSNFITGFLILTVVSHSISNVGAFFMCGLPGMIDYILLSMNINRKLEKQINSYLNMYIRVPGLLWCCFLIYYFIYRNNLDTIYTTTSIFIIISILWNALFFAHLVCVNYGQHLGKEKTF